MTAEDASIPGDDRRDQMLRAAASIIAERGFSETRIADVAHRAGVSPALVIYYFGTKDHLLTEALRFSEASFYATADEMLDGLSDVRRRLEGLVRLTCMPQENDEIPGSWGLWFDVWSQAFRHPAVARDRIELDQRWRNMITRVVDDGIANAEIERIDSTEFAVTFAALMDGLAIQVALTDPVVDADRAYRIAMRFASQALGFAWAPPRRRRASRAAGRTT